MGESDYWKAMMKDDVSLKFAVAVTALLVLQIAFMSQLEFVQLPQQENPREAEFIIVNGKVSSALQRFGWRTGAINAAMSELPATGGTIRLPPGAFEGTLYIDLEFTDEVSVQTAETIAQTNGERR